MMVYAHEHDVSWLPDIRNDSLQAAYDMLCDMYENPSSKLSALCRQCDWWIMWARRDDITPYLRCVPLSDKVNVETHTSTSSTPIADVPLDPALELAPNCVESFRDQWQLLSGEQVTTILDIGANTGQTTSIYRSLFPKAFIYGFEPFPEAFETYRERFSLDNLVMPLRQALCEESGARQFFVNRSSVANSCLPAASDAAYWVDPPASEIENIGTIEVPATTLDDFCTQRNLNGVHVLKMDIQGGELLALQGAAKQLAKGTIDLIYTEILFVPIYEGQAFFYDVAAFLARFDYTVFKVYNHACSANGPLKWADALFISPKIRKALMQQSPENRFLRPRAAEMLPTQKELDKGAPVEPAEQEIARLTAEVRELRGVWQAVEHSTGWRILNKWRTLRDRMVPDGSRRRKLYMHILERLLPD